MSLSIYKVRYQTASTTSNECVLLKISSTQIDDKMKIYLSVDQESLSKVKINQQSTNSRE